MLVQHSQYTKGYITQGYLGLVGPGDCSYSSLFSQVIDMAAPLQARDEISPVTEAFLFYTHLTVQWGSLPMYWGKSSANDWLIMAGIKLIPADKVSGHVSSTGAGTGELAFAFASKSGIYWGWGTVQTH